MVAKIPYTVNSCAGNGRCAAQTVATNRQRAENHHRRYTSRCISIPGSGLGNQEFHRQSWRPGAVILADCGAAGTRRLKDGPDWRSGHEDPIPLPIKFRRIEKELPLIGRQPTSDQTVDRRTITDVGVTWQVGVNSRSVHGHHGLDDEHSRVCVASAGITVDELRGSQRKVARGSVEGDLGQSRPDICTRRPDIVKNIS